MTPTEHEKNLRRLPCCVSRRTPVTLHHTHGGSLKLLSWHVGMGQRQNPYLQIPLHADYHVGRHGIDAGMGVRKWERLYGDQVTHLGWVSRRLGYDVMDLAQQWERENRSKSIGGTYADEQGAAEETSSERSRLRRGWQRGEGDSETEPQER